MLALVASLALAAAPKSTLLVLDLTSDGSIDGREALLLTSLIASAAAEDPSVEVLTMLDLRDALGHDEERRLLGCGGDPACYADPSPKMAEVDRVLATTAGAVGRSVTMTVSLLDPKSAKVLRKESGVVERGDPGAAELRRLVLAVLGRGEPARERFALPGGARSFAVLELVPTGVSPETAAALTPVLSTELKRLEGATVIGRDDIKAMLTLEAEKQLLGCAEDSCLAEIGGALGVDYLVAGQIGRLASTYVVTLRLIDPTKMIVRNRVTESFTGREEELVGATRFAARRLVGVESGKAARLHLLLPTTDATAYVDGERFDPVAGTSLSPGRHGLAVSASGYLDWQGEVYVDAPETRLAVELTAEERRWYQSWILWTVVGVAAVASAGTAIALTQGGGGPTGPGPTTVDETFPFGIEVSLPPR